MTPSGSGEAEPQRHTEYGSCFFLSYAHTPRVFDDGPDLNYWVRQFFRDLCNELVSCDPSWHRPTGLPGFMDDNIPEGALWRQSLARELATCRVFVPLYNRAYFTSPNCGKEWAVFRARQMAHVAQTGVPNEAVLPVIWKPPRAEDPDGLAAQRFARVEVARLLLANTSAVTEGRRDRRVYLALKAEIDALLAQYRARFQGMRDHLGAEIVRTLALNDAALLGREYPGPIA